MRQPPQSRPDWKHRSNYSWPFEACRQSTGERKLFNSSTTTVQGKTSAIPIQSRPLIWYRIDNHTTTLPPCAQALKPRTTQFYIKYSFQQVNYHFPTPSTTVLTALETNSLRNTTETITRQLGRHRAQLRIGSPVPQARYIEWRERAGSAKSLCVGRCCVARASAKSDVGAELLKDV